MLLRLWTLAVLPGIGMLALILVLQGLDVPAPWAVSASVAAWAWLMILLWARQGRAGAPGGPHRPRRTAFDRSEPRR